MADAFITADEMVVYYANKMGAVLEALDAIIRKTEIAATDITIAWKGQAAETAVEKLQEFAIEMRNAKDEIACAKSEILGVTVTE